MTKKLRVWHIPQVPGKSFRVDVSSIPQAIVTMNTLANYDLFQYENNIKPDYSNASGLQELQDGGEWHEWYDEFTGEDIQETMQSIEDAA